MGCKMKAVVIGIKDHEKLSPFMKYMIKREVAKRLPMTRKEILDSMRELGKAK